MTTKLIIRLYRIGHVIFHINSINFGPNIAINTRLFMKTEADFCTYKASSLGYTTDSYLSAEYFCSKCALGSLTTW
jgi:glycosyltransferase involved in cell wall biosynthesis